jgi:uncharacterized membrane protein YidH (DUF202 family)
MNEALQEQLTELLQAMTTTITTGGEYAAGQLPELYRQVVLAERVATTLSVVCATVALVIWAIALHRAHRKHKALPNPSLDRESVGAWIVALALLAFPLGAWLLVSWAYVLQAWLAPHMVLLDYVTGLVK